jgi:hypothetical protein
LTPDDLNHIVFKKLTFEISICATGHFGKFGVSLIGNFSLSVYRFNRSKARVAFYLISSMTNLDKLIGALSDRMEWKMEPSVFFSPVNYTVFALHVRIMSLPLPPAEAENGQSSGGLGGRDRRKPVVIDKVRNLSVI